MLAYYYLSALLSLCLMALYFRHWHRHYNVHFTIIFTMIPCCNLGYLLLARANNVESAEYANAVAYLGATFLPVFFSFCIFALCKYTMPRLIKPVFFLISGFCYTCVLFPEDSNLFYVTSELSSDMGASYLSCTYGPVHTLTYAFLGAVAVASLSIIIYSFRRFDVSRKTLVLLLCNLMIDVMALAFTKTISPAFETLPAAFIINQIMFLVIIDRVNSYNIDDTVSRALESLDVMGCITFDSTLAYLGCNKTADSWFPELHSLHVDETIVHETELTSLLYDRMLRLKLDCKPEVFHLNRDGKTYRFDSDVILSGKEVTGFQFRITDDTTEQQLIESAIDASKAKSHFLTNMSHEIRTPITAVLGLDTMILRECTDPTIRSYALDIQSAGQTLLSLVNDILDQSKIEAGRMELVPAEYSLVSLVSDISNMISTKADSKNLSFGIEVDPDLPSVLLGDDIRIRQILINLLNNAVKYTETGGITLKISGRMTDRKATLRFTVTDTGIGIRPEDFDKVKSQFVRIDEHRNRNIEGSGLGMNIVVELLDLMGSSLSFDSVYGQGSTFSFKLEQPIVSLKPIGDIAAQLKQRAETFSYAVSFVAPGARLLVVDDNPMNLNVFCGLLKQTRVTIDTAASGSIAVDMAALKHYDIIFLDHMMPGKDGIQTFREIREFPASQNKDTPVIILTANAVSGAKENYLELGFTDFLSKPIDPDRLEEMVKEHLPENLVEQVTIISDTSERNTVPAANYSEEITELPKVNGTDWRYGCSHFKSKDMFLRTAGSFAGSLNNEADELQRMYDNIVSTLGQHNDTSPESRQAAVSDALAEFRILVHAMKSEAAILGIMTLSGVAALLEDSAAHGETELILALTPRFLEEWRSFGASDKLGCLTQAVTGGKIQISDPAVPSALLDQLKLMMDSFDVEGADAVMEKLEQYRYEGEASELIVKLATAVSDLQSDTVIETCDALKSAIA